MFDESEWSLVSYFLDDAETYILESTQPLASSITDLLELSIECLSLLLLSSLGSVI